MFLIYISAKKQFINFSVQPARVVATYADNTIKPTLLGKEIYRQQQIYGGCVSAPENNMYDSCILIVNQLGGNLYAREKKDSSIKQNTVTEYGWNTNGGNKGNMITALTVAVNTGLLIIPDKDLVKELRSYTRTDMLNKAIDPRLTKRHFDLLMALAIAWQMKDYQPVFFAKKPKVEPEVNKPLNMGWVDQKNNMDNIIEETYLN